MGILKEAVLETCVFCIYFVSRSLGEFLLSDMAGKFVFIEGHLYVVLYCQGEGV